VTTKHPKITGDGDFDHVVLVVFEEIFNEVIKKK